MGAALEAGSQAPLSTGRRPPQASEPGSVPASARDASARGAGPVSSRGRAGKETHAVVFEAALEGHDEESFSENHKQDYLNHLSLKLKCDKVVITSMRASPPGEPKAVYVEVQAAGFPEGQGQAQEAVEKIQAGSAVDADANGS